MNSQLKTGTAAFHLDRRRRAPSARSLSASHEATAELPAESYRGFLQARDDNHTLGLVKQIPLTDVPPGRYLLQVETTPRGTSKDVKPITRETLVTVVPAASR